MKAMIANRSMWYGGKRLSKDDPFEADERHALLLSTYGSASYAESAPEKEAKPDKKKKRKPKAEKEAPGYSRRDMRAEA